MRQGTTFAVLVIWLLMEGGYSEWILKYSKELNLTNYAAWEGGELQASNYFVFVGSKSCSYC